MSDITVISISTLSQGCRRQLSRMALATRSATAVMRLSGDAQCEALRRHFEQFPPAITTTSCPARRI